MVTLPCKKLLGLVTIHHQSWLVTGWLQAWSVEKVTGILTIKVEICTH